MSDVAEAYGKGLAYLLDDIARAIEDECPGSRTALNQTLQAGGFLQLETAISAAGIIAIKLFVTSPQGERVLVMELEP